MEIFSSVFGKVMDIVASAIVVLALHVPFLMNVLTALPVTPVAQPVVEKSLPESSTSTLLKEISPEAMAEWQKKHNALMAEKCSDVCYPFDFESFYTGDEGVKTKDGYGYSFTNADGSMKIILGKPTRENQSRNPSYGVYIGGKFVGEVTGQAFTQSSFSPDGKYFAVRAETHLGANTYDFDLYVLDLNQKNVSDISVFQVTDRTLSKANPFIETSEYIESYKWIPENKIDIVTYTVAVFPGGNNYYRVTPKTIWSYDTKTGKISSVDDATFLSSSAATTSPIESKQVMPLVRRVTTTP